VEVAVAIVPFIIFLPVEDFGLLQSYFISLCSGVFITLSLEAQKVNELLFP
jgi:hypothetical protein